MPLAVGYNAQVAVDAKNKMIVDQDVTTQVVDMGLLTQTAEPARALLGNGLVMNFRRGILAGRFWLLPRVVLIRWRPQGLDLSRG
jgi:hypothetical protein